jgi:heme-degrading monooxygenase HmoA
MFISITSSKYTEDQAPKVEAFLKTFLPRMRQAPGVVSIYNYARPDKGDEHTVVIWESEAALKAYRQSDLVKEAIAFEQAQGLPGTREAYPLLLAL